MLLRENYTAEHIAKLRQETGADPSILVRTVFAFGLLEAIRSVDMPFIIIAEKTPASVSGEMNRQKVRPVIKRFVLRPHTGH